ncbi:MAG TPA: DegT/DnrJ/EryC1/StrS family aminotransferase [bacterium]|nr:DegT/DnrJ/EryC1/StrS family aminotransferase [bacterium]HPS28783.1 DegT/DnrJ/EryC1/StrS family aminotransferase [bacterium]
MRKIEFIDLKTQYLEYKDEIDKAIENVCERAAFIMGSEVAELEKNLSEFTGSPYAISCASGTDALLLALMALDIGPGDEVITTPFTFIATAEVITLLGATPVFADIDKKTCNIDHRLIERAITRNTKAIIPVGLYGTVADMDEINAIALKYGITVIEDACQSFGAKYKDKMSCNLSKIGCTSFFPSKPLGCYGDGGALFTDDAAIAEKMKSLRIHGQTKRYFHKYIGINGRLDTIQAAVLNVKMKYLKNELKKREEIGRYYTENLSENGKITIPYINKDRTSVYAQFSILVENRDKLIEKLNENGIPTAVHYPRPLHLQEAYSQLGYKKGDFALSEYAGDHILSIPMGPFLKREDQDYIIETILKNI